MTSEEELAAAVHARPHWTAAGNAAVYAPPGTSAQVRVVAITGAGHRERFRAIIVRGGTAEHSRPAASAAEAVRWAEQVPLG